MPGPDPATDTLARPVLATSGLGVTFGESVHAVADVTFSLGRDDFIVVLGPSGAGKSTLLRSLNRLVTPTRGGVHFEGEDVSHASGARLRWLRQNVGMVFQQFNLVDRRTVLQNVLAGRLRFARGPIRRLLSLVSWFPRADREVAFEALQRVGIADKAYTRADNLSGGQQQRVAIARLIAQQPKAVLADEPIASLDPASAEDVMQLLRELHDRDGVPVIVNLHQVDVARRFAKRIIGMNAGRVVFDGPPTQLDAAAVRNLYGQEEPPTAATPDRAKHTPSIPAPQPAAEPTPAQAIGDIEDPKNTPSAPTLAAQLAAVPVSYPVDEY